MLFLCVLTFLVAVPSAHLVSVLLSTPQKWLNRTVWYEMDPTMAPEDQKMIQNAIDDFHDYTCVEWKLRSSGNYTDYVVFTTNATTFGGSAIGRAGGVQLVRLGPLEDGSSSTAQKATILHLMLHTVGFRHEHQRPDRDEYIRMEGCVDGDKLCFKFDAMPPESVGFPYDICSVMHYKKNFWPNYNIVPLPSLAPSECLKDELSDIDVKKINKWFDCPESKGLPQALSLAFGTFWNSVTTAGTIITDYYVNRKNRKPT